MSPWIPLVYQYCVGGLLFVTSLVLAWRTGALRLDHRSDWRLLIALSAGLVGFMAVHLLWIALAAG